MTMLGFTSLWPKCQKEPFTFCLLSSKPKHSGRTKMPKQNLPVKFRVFRKEFLRNHSMNWTQIFRENLNCYVLSIFRVFILLASSDSDKHMLMRLKIIVYSKKAGNNRRAQFFIFLGKALSGHVMSVHQASSEIACTQKCLSNPKCASFNFEIQQPRSLSTCELNAVSRTSPNSKLKSRHGFAYYEPLTPRERPKQQTTAFSPTTSKLMMAASTTQGAQEVIPTQDQARTPASMFPSTQPATTAAPGKWFAKSKGTHLPLGN